MSEEENKVKIEEKEVKYFISEINDKNLSNKTSVGKRFFQIDVMKTICIICVIGVHTLSTYTKYDALWQALQPVPLFFVILGFNMGNSFRKKNLHKLSDMYSFSYFKRMFWRLIFPLLLINLICFIIDLLVISLTGYHANGWSSTQLQPVSWGETNLDFGTGNYRPTYTYVNIIYILIGTPYFPGPGEFYIVILMQFILIFPLIYKLFERNPILGLISCYIIEISFQLITGSPDLPVGQFFDDHTFLFCGSIFRYMSVIGLGIWFVNNHDLFSKKNFFVIIMAIPAVCILILVYWGNFFFPSLLDNPILADIFKHPAAGSSGYAIKIFRTFPWWEKANLFTYFWPALLFLIFMKVLPSELNKDKPISKSISKFFEKYSRLTYHILLVQIVYFFISIPIYQYVSISINESFYKAFILPIVEPYGITSEWDIQSTQISLEASIGISIMRLIAVFINCAVTFTLAIGFYKFEQGIQKNLKKIGKPLKKTKITA